MAAAGLPTGLDKCLAWGARAAACTLEHVTSAVLPRQLTARARKRVRATRCCSPGRTLVRGRGPRLRGRAPGRHPLRRGRAADGLRVAVRAERAVRGDAAVVQQHALRQVHPDPAAARIGLLGGVEGPAARARGAEPHAGAREPALDQPSGCTALRVWRRGGTPAKGSCTCVAACWAVACACAPWHRTGNARAAGAQSAGLRGRPGRGGCRPAAARADPRLGAARTACGCSRASRGAPALSAGLARALALTLSRVRPAGARTG